MGLNHPQDLNAWARWQQKRRPLQRLRGALRPVAQTPPVLAVRGTTPRVLVALDSTKPTTVASLVRPLEFLSAEDAAVIAPGDVREHLPPGAWRLLPVEPEIFPEVLRDCRVVVASGHYLPVGGLAYNWSRHLGSSYVVVQHGLMTPHAPPLPADAHLLAFSNADAEFWRSGRQDISSEVVGSQLLWEAKRQPAAAVDPNVRPVFLGQLHGAELPRRGLARAAVQFCREMGAVYRPHPAESDRLSRLQHALWQRRGISFDRSALPLSALNAPVASVFSTGVLEAAARGIPAWVTYPGPPAWLEEFWERYGMSRWGQEPTRCPAVPETEPSRAIAQIISRQLGGSL